MTQFKGTPGPWSLDEFDNIVHGEEPLRGWGRKETVRVSGVALPGRVTEEYAANTRLVAAAPELLEALWELVNEYESIVTHEFGSSALDVDPNYIRAKAAIAKATGETK